MVSIFVFQMLKIDRVVNYRRESAWQERNKHQLAVQLCLMLLSFVDTCVSDPLSLNISCHLDPSHFHSIIQINFTQMYLICLYHLFDDSLLASNRAAAFLHLVKLNKALADAETAITLNPVWEKVYICLLHSASFSSMYFVRDQTQ